MVEYIVSTICDNKLNKHKKVVLYDLKISSKKNINLFSIPNSLNSGCKLGGENKSICIPNINFTVVLYISIKTKEGFIFYVYLDRNFTYTKVEGYGSNSDIRININKYHKLMGHVNKDMTRDTSKELG